MINKVKQEQTIDLAWEHLYKRLAQDNLLPSQEISFQRTIFRSPTIRWAASIAILCVCLLTVWLIRQPSGIQQDELLVLSNEKYAPPLATALEDGSIVYLSEEATISYPERFDDDKRIITLQGNAFFEISRQPERPFLIETGLAAIEVLGTFFRVENDDKSSFHLSVINGEVKVTLKENHQTMVVKAGETVLWESGVLQLQPTDLHQFDNCFEKIHFKDEPLVNMVRIINHHSFTPIEVTPEVGNRRLNFVFSGETPELTAKLICMALNLNYTQHQDIIYITP